MLWYDLWVSQHQQLSENKAMLAALCHYSLGVSQPGFSPIKVLTISYLALPRVTLCYLAI